MSAQLTTSTFEAWQPVVNMVCDSLDSAHSKRAYRRNTIDFITWHTSTNTQGLTKAGLNAYKTYLREAGVSDTSINQRLSAVRKLVSEAADNGLIDERTAGSIKAVKGIAVRGEKLGTWLEKDQAETMLRSPDTDTLKGLRDRAILSVMIGCGLRREEVVNLNVSHIQQRSGRWVIVDLVGKRNKTRSVPMAAWVKHAIDCWLLAAAIPDGDTGPLFRPIRRGGHLQAGKMTSQAVWDVVDAHTPVGMNVSPHDLRRTYAKLSRAGGATLEQIQLTLGHENLDTTRRYLGTDLDLRESPSDCIKLDV